MKVVHALQPLRKSIFLAGPTPRAPGVASWRPAALGILDGIGFDGDVYVPESADWAARRGYDDQLLWEWEAIHMATVVAFWVPRDLVDLPAFTTNVEFGLTASSSKVMLGHPPEAPKMAYLARLAGRYHIPVFESLEALLLAAVQRARAPFGEP